MHSNEIRHHTHTHTDWLVRAVRFVCGRLSSFLQSLHFTIFWWDVCVCRSFVRDAPTACSVCGPNNIAYISDDSGQAILSSLHVARVSENAMKCAAFTPHMHARMMPPIVRSRWPSVHRLAVPDWWLLFFYYLFFAWHLNAVSFHPYKLMIYHLLARQPPKRINMRLKWNVISCIGQIKWKMTASRWRRRAEGKQRHRCNFRLCMHA